MRSTIVAVLLSVLYVATATPLDDYVNKPDPTFKWELSKVINGDGYTAFFINMTSQTWLTAEDSSRPVWVHWLTICLPPKVDYGTALLFIDGDDDSKRAPDEIDNLIEPVCGKVNAIVACLNQIPDQPIVFADGKKRVEDAIIAYTWSHFMNNTNEPDWLLRLPMTKASVRAMDTITAFASTLEDVPPIETFMVAGASKRGWTTWTTAAVDKRVIAAVPIVIPILNIVPNMNHHYQAYGGWSFALSDYLDMHLMHYLNMQQFLDLAAVVDPYSYLDRLTMPKYLVCSTGDEFFLPDSTRYFYNDLQGPTRLRLVPNAEHSLIGHQYDVIDSMRNFYQLIVSQQAIPDYSFQMIRSNTTASIIVKLLDDYVPLNVKVWTAHTLSFVQRDFRLVTCDNLDKCLNPVFWWETEIQPTNGVYQATFDAPEKGWLGFFIEINYFVNGGPLVFTTEVNVVPDSMPYAPCGNHCQD